MFLADAPTAAQAGRRHFGHLARAALFAAGAAAIVNLLVFVVARAALDFVFVAPLRGPEPPPLSASQVVVVSAAPALAATSLFGFTAQLARSRRRVVQAIASVILLPSLGVPLSLVGVATSTRVALIVVLLVATAVSLGVLRATVGPRRSE